MMTSSPPDRPRASTHPVPTVPIPGGQRALIDRLIAQVTVSSEPWVLIWDLQDRLLEAGALYELVVPLSRAIRERSIGQYALVVATRDEPTIDVLRSLAIRHDLPLYIAPHRDALDEARPAAELTAARAAIFQAMSRFGVATVASVAQSVGVGHTSVSNTLGALAEDGLLFRREGSGRRGHVYWHPSAAIPAGAAVAVPPIDNLPLPRPLVVDVAAAAEAEGRQPAELLADAWREYQLAHRDELAARYKSVAELVRGGDREGLQRALAVRAREKARRAAR